MTAGAVITPAGIGAGDPAVLAALIARGGGGVLAYCRQVAGPGQAIRAAIDAFSRFRVEICAGDDISGAAAMELLRTTTARAAAARGVNTTAARSRGAPAGCHGPEIELLRHVEGSFTPSQQERVVAHLARCSLCAAAVRRLEAGARAFAAPSAGTLRPRAARILVEAMVMAAPVNVDGMTQSAARRTAVELVGIAVGPPSPSDPPRPPVRTGEDQAPPTATGPAEPEVARSPDRPEFEEAETGPTRLEGRRFARRLTARRQGR